MKKFIFLLVVGLLVLTSCDKNVVYKKYRKDFTEYRWKKAKVVEFSPNIEDTGLYYEIYFLFRHVYGFRHPDLDIDVEVTTPSGKVTKSHYTINVIGDGNKYISDCAGDYCDLEAILEDDFKFNETGVYNLKITQNTANTLNYVMEVGLMIKKKS